VNLLLLAARLVLGAVFLVSGLAKLIDRPGSRQAMIGFGVPERLATPSGILLPLAELATAILLIPLATAWWGGIAALVLLLLFVAGISVNLARGRTPDCHCFGQLHSEPIGWPTLARNGILAVIAAFVIVAGSSDAGASAVGWLGQRTGMEQLGIVFGVVVLLLIAAEGWLLLHLMQQNGRLLARMEIVEEIAAGGLPSPAAQVPAGPVAGLPVGAQAPAFSLSGLHGETMTLDALRATGKPALLIFSDPNCGPCNALLPEIGRWQREDAARLTIALVSRGTAEANRAKSAEHGLTQVLLQQDREVAQAYLSNGTPGAVVVGPDGTINSPLAQGSEQIRGLVARTVGRIPLAPAAVNNNGNGNGSVPPRPAVPASRVGSAAPEVSLPDLDGKDFSLEQFRGKDTLLLFWNPGCGFCQRMLNDLKEWESNPTNGSPKLLIVSTGTPEANKALGLSSTIVLDQGFVTGRAFGASGTPSAVLVDARGKIASEVGVGAPAVLALAAGPADAGKRG
jgi:peroxiredoxin/uncharacterized membrane protein YphA (DoxX/SURF4 family)